MAKRVKKKAPENGVKVTGMTRRTRAELKTSHGRGAGEDPVEHVFVDLPADPTLEVRWEIPADWDGRIPLDAGALSGARVKPVVFAPEDVAEQIDRHVLRQQILDKGAVYCKVPVVHVLRERRTRDARHDAEMSVEDSLRIFAEETRPEDPDELVGFALALAREADAGVRK